mgnify:CR=1 FL=1
MPDTITRYFSQPATAYVERRVFHPWRRAFLMATAYLCVCITYIIVSGIVVSNMAESAEQLQRYETIKEIVFVVVTACFLLFLSWGQFSRLARRELDVARHSEALLNTERQALTAIFAASLAHDINNVLVLCDYGFGELLESGQLSDSQRALVGDMVKAKSNLQVLVKRLMNVGLHGMPGEMGDVAVGEVVEDVVRLSEVHCSMLGCELSVGKLSGIHMWGNAALIHQMLVNLIMNAADAAGSGGKVRVVVDVTDQTITFEVHDSGPGVPPAERSVIFDTFYTTKPTGTGLGLLSVKACSAAHHGTVNVMDSALGGACFCVRLPLAST